MAQNFKRLGAINPTANTQTNVYVVPAATEAVISTITVCNQSADNASFSLIQMIASEFASPAPAATFLVRGAVVPAADTLVLTMGITANAGSIIAANTNSPNISFGAFGSEITP
jgi:hypothetical protein